ncbi:unnamed protein product [Moneuplotes crassus]|uniref:Uncharacterized protein n=1 Tax=Euplotes crassus TaxID=5936 RepID=A0AAD1X974_EUPCR|nr:unnamed protein product [Moneuplotes crassus]
MRPITIPHIHSRSHRILKHSRPRRSTKMKPNVLNMKNIRPFMEAEQHQNKEPQNEQRRNLKITTNFLDTDHVMSQIQGSLTNPRTRFPNTARGLEKQILNNVNQKIGFSNKRLKSSFRPKRALPSDVPIIKIENSSKEMIVDDSQKKSSEYSYSPNAKASHADMPLNKSYSSPLTLAELPLKKIKETTDTNLKEPVMQAHERDLFTPQARSGHNNFIPDQKKRGAAVFKIKRGETVAFKRNSSISDFSNALSFIKSKAQESYDSINLQKELIEIFGDTTSVFSGKPDSKSIGVVFRALDRLSKVEGNLKYYFRMMYNIMLKAIYCKVIELPEILLEQLKEKNLDYYSDPNNFIPYFESNEELMKTLNSVIKTAQKIEKESKSKVIEMEAELRGCKEFTKQLEKEVIAIRSTVKTRTLERFIDLTQENAKLVKELNILKYKMNANDDQVEKNLMKLEIEKLKQELKTTRLSQQNQASSAVNSSKSIISIKDHEAVP